MRICLDLDGVLADVSTSALRYLSSKYEHVPDSISGWTLWDGVTLEANVSRRDILAALDHAWAEGLASLLEPQSPRIIAKLKQSGHTLNLLTARSKQTIPQVLKWLDSYKLSFDDYIFVNNSQSKMLYPFDLLVDDNPRLLSFRDPRFILFDRPWNRDNAYRKRIRSLAALARFMPST